MIVNDAISSYIKSPLRQIGAKVELLSSAGVLLHTFYDTDRVKSYSVERLGDEAKFFGFGVAQKLNLKLLDVSRELDIPSKSMVKVSFSIYGGEYFKLLPTFYITEINRDETTNELSITAYDDLAAAGGYTFADLGLFYPLTLKDVARACADKLGLDLFIPSSATNVKNIVLDNNDYSQYVQELSFTLRSAEDVINIESMGMIYAITIDNAELFGDYPASLSLPSGLYTRSDLWKAGANVTVYCNSDTFTYAEHIYTEVVEDVSFNVSFASPLNADGAEKVEEVLTDIAEATQTIYFINKEDALEFKALLPDAEAASKIGKDQYFTLDSKTNRRLTTVASVTALGDNVSATTGESGTTQYIRDNIFYTTFEGVSADLAALLDDAIAKVGGLTINQFVCSWRGNPLLEIGDKIELITKDDSSVFSFVLNDVIEYTGGFSQKTQWEFIDSEATESNPNNLGELLHKTFAIVDKANKEIDLLASETSSIAESVSTLHLDTEKITSSVQKIAEDTSAALEGATDEIAQLKSKVEATITAEDVQIQIENEVAKGAGKVTTSTGYTFDENGLTVRKSSSEMETTVTEDGMKVSKSGEVMLDANNTGVTAVNLHATTYLIIGTHSRLEDYGGRTGCFWIGG